MSISELRDLEVIICESFAGLHQQVFKVVFDVSYQCNFNLCNMTQAVKNAFSQSLSIVNMTEEWYMHIGTRVCKALVSVQVIREKPLDLHICKLQSAKEADWMSILSHTWSMHSFDTAFLSCKT